MILLPSRSGLKPVWCLGGPAGHSRHPGHGHGPSAALQGPLHEAAQAKPGYCQRLMPTRTVGGWM